MIKDKLCDSQVSISNIVTSSHNGEGHQAEDVAEYRTIKLQDELRAWRGASHVLSSLSWGHRAGSWLYYGAVTS